MANAAEFLGLPIPVWSLFATLLLAIITAIYVALTYKIARGAETAAQASINRIVYLRKHYHFGPHKISMYLKRYHDVQVSPSGVWRIFGALGGEWNRRRSHPLEAIYTT